MGVKLGAGSVLVVAGGMMVDAVGVSVGIPAIMGILLLCPVDVVLLPSLLILSLLWPLDSSVLPFGSLSKASLYG